MTNSQAIVLEQPHIQTVSSQIDLVTVASAAPKAMTDLECVKQEKRQIEQDQACQMIGSSAFENWFRLDPGPALASWRQLLWSFWHIGVAA